ncbi:hypothetical protein [Candidatus Nesciobacter abundans]|uniref:Uncharacterized protein n=1 Tax=Candidatus Nesciobacter abundans TaxID=2601668 RepID=A0A5C0UFZ4_9PROT|nr:hypothetical protein [Candidatus Nesciobacter abundans]QEK39015.1 hypothetical protein FZC36_01015 [Candidatus Nesciobacter abundans]
MFKVLYKILSRLLYLSILFFCLFSITKISFAIKEINKDIEFANVSKNKLHEKIRIYDYGVKYLDKKIDIDLLEEVSMWMLGYIPKGFKIFLP